MDTGGVMLFHAATVGLIVWSNKTGAQVWALMALLVLGVDLSYYFSPPKQRAKLDPMPESDNPPPLAAVRSFALELFILFAPPLAFVTWFQFLIWQHQILSRNELLAILIAMPAVVGLVSWIIQYRTTHHHARINKQSGRFIGFSVLGIWIGATFFFVLFLGAFLMKCFQ